MKFLNKCFVSPRIKYDQYGQELNSPKLLEKCAIVKLIDSQQHTSVRADQAASRAYADEQVGLGILLLTPQTKAEINFRIDIEGISLRVKSMHKRFSVNGKLDHIEVGCELWE